MIAYICLFFLFSCNGQQSEQKMNLQIYNNPLERNNKYKQDKTTTLNNNEHMRVNSIIKPSYNVYVRSKNTQFLLLVDDVPAFKFFGKESESGMGINGNIPINQCLLISGKHHVKGILFPKYGATKLNEDTFLTLTNSVKESGTSEEIQFLEIKSPDGYYKKSSPDDQENN
jgi:hypothetical protein